MSILIWAMVGIAVWHFAVLVPDRFWGGIIGAFLAALVGALRIRVRAADSWRPARQSARIERGAVAAARLTSRPRRLVPVRGSERASSPRDSLKAVQRRLDRDVRLRRARLVRSVVTAEEIWGEIPPRDLGRRPPQRLLEKPRRRPLRRRVCGAGSGRGQPVMSLPRSTGRKRVGSTGAPAAAAIDSATASACWQARPPCLIGKVVASPTA